MSSLGAKAVSLRSRRHMVRRESNVTGLMDFHTQTPL